MADGSGFLNLTIKKQRKGWILLFALFHVLNVKLVKKGSGVSGEEVYVETGDY